ncbi:hypothetical protein NQZ79_g2913 [Umbelopsis isabellina]|nr:hypothetical protein NQZ79_g2913 [Umbelopsis isabellina]
MTDAQNGIKPIRYRLHSHNSQQPPKRRKTRSSRNASSKAPGPPAPSLARSATPTSSTSSSHNSHNSPLHDCNLYFPQRSEEDETAMARARTLGASIAQSANECTHVVLQVLNPSKKQQQQIFNWKEQGKLVVSLTWVTACGSTWSRQPEFNHPPGRGDHSLVTGHNQGIKISINPFNHDPPPLEVARDNSYDEAATFESRTSMSPTLKYTEEEEDSRRSDESSLRNLEELATRYAKSTPPPSQRPAPVSASRQEQIQQRIRNAMAPSSSAPNVKIWTEERITPEALMAERRDGTRKSMRLGSSKK